MILKPYYNKEVTVFAQTNFRDQRKSFGIKRADRRRHMYAIGKTGMGKTSMLEHMIVQDIRAGEGVCVLDPKGDLIGQILHYIPASRIGDVLYFNPADIEYPVAFNLLFQQGSGLAVQESVNGLAAIFSDLWKDAWGTRFEYVFKNVLLTLLADENNTILHILPLLTDENFRQRLLGKINDPGLLDFWLREYGESPERFEAQAIEPLRDKIGQMISNPLVRNIVGQAKTSFNFAEVLNQKKIVLMTLNKNEIGQDAVKMFGSCFILKLLMQIKSFKANNYFLPDFYLYLDEFQNFTEQQLIEIITSSDYGLNLILANQYLDQVSEPLAKAIFGNIGTLAAFRLGASDAELLADEFKPQVVPDDLIKLPEYNIVLKLSIDGETSAPFTAVTMEPLPAIGLADKIINYSRKMYGHNKREVEDNLLKSLCMKTRVSPAKPMEPTVTSSAGGLKTFRQKLSAMAHKSTVDKPAAKPLAPPAAQSSLELHELAPGQEAAF